MEKLLAVFLCVEEKAWGKPSLLTCKLTRIYIDTSVLMPYNITSTHILPASRKPGAILIVDGYKKGEA